MISSFTARARGLRLVGAACCGAFLFACAQPERPSTSQPPADWPARSAAVAGLAQWTLQARVAVRMGAHDEPQQGGQMSLYWRHADASDALEFTGPLGKSVFALTVDVDGARARDERGAWHRGADAERLLYELSGWRIPVTSLQYWIRGIPAPQAPARLAWGEDGELQEISQQQWTVRYREYAPTGALHLPRRLLLSRAVAGEPPIEIKLVIGEWRAG